MSFPKGTSFGRTTGTLRQLADRILRSDKVCYILILNECRLLATLEMTPG